VSPNSNTSHQKTINRYVKSVGRGLVASRKTRVRLLNGLRNELAEQSEDLCCTEDITRTLGSVAVMRENLQSEVELDEIERCRTHSRIRNLCYIVISMCIILVLLSILYHHWNNVININVTQEIIITSMLIN